MNQRTILIVEDDLTLREAIVDTLDIASYKSLAADSGEAAIVLLNNEKPDMIISDINMPGINGHELLKIIKCKLPKIPVILITAYEDVVSVVSAVNAIRNGAIDYIVKPFEPRELIDRLEKHVLPLTNENNLPVAEAESSKELLSLVN